jgi:hypothetical protein
MHVDPRLSVRKTAKNDQRRQGTSGKRKLKQKQIWTSGAQKKRKLKMKEKFRASQQQPTPGL